MIFDLRELIRSGKTTKTFYFEYEADKNLIDLPLVEAVNPIKVTGEITLTGDNSAVIEGEVAFSLKGCCTRCLEETQHEYACEFYEEADDSDDCAYKVVNGKIDIKKIANDTVITNLPINFLCKEDCKGLCVGCGVNLNHDECKCK